MDKSYLEYPNRTYGQDHNFYNWCLATDRPKIEWKNGAKVAVCFIVPIEFFPLNPSGAPFKHPGAMVTPYPDLRHFTVRDYGNRVGVYRILSALKSAKISATFAVNGEIAKRYPPLLKAILDAKHEVAANGLSTDAIHHEALTPADESSLIDEALNCFETPPSGWMSPARNQSSRTLNLLSDKRLSYCLDWEADSVPLETKNGLTLIPNSYELSDFTLLHTRKQSEEAWLKQMKNSIDLLIEEHSRFGSQMLGLTLTPYVIGQPFRIWALQELLSFINVTEGVEAFTAGEIDKQFRTQ